MGKQAPGWTFSPGKPGFFSETGRLSRAKNFEFRPEQQEMAVALAKALKGGEHLIVEAGTGVGKSLAYLVPAILHAVSQNKKAVISTHTINLQEQLTPEGPADAPAGGCRGSFRSQCSRGAATTPAPGGCSAPGSRRRRSKPPPRWRN
ncbi:MAG: hypothetical protein CM1200mP34_3520 [Verrucomicrobiales bacterium]|nr:MAG: hypothetical protein CM1200mP34_3520 [Verrucomicrobiales bacterium]